MQIFTHEVFEEVASLYEDMRPSEKTLLLIRQFAYTYRVKNGEPYCLN